MPMKLEDFVKVTVKPGEPLVAAAWNNLVEGLDAVIQKLRAMNDFALRVTIQNAGIDLGSVRVTAVDQAGNLAFEAVRPVPPGKDHVFASLNPGTYQVRAEAPGFAPNSKTVEIKQAAEILSLTLAPSGSVMPDLFGLKLRDALAALKTNGITTPRVLDVTGKGELPDSPSPEAADAAVLAQWPPSKTPVAAGDAVHLIIAVVPKPTVMAEVPNLIGLTEVDARKLLESKGLKLGTVTVAQPRATGSTVPLPHGYETYGTYDTQTISI
jgi:hypothetical protein